MVCALWPIPYDKHLPIEALDDERYMVFGGSSIDCGKSSLIATSSRGKNSFLATTGYEIPSRVSLRKYFFLTLSVDLQVGQQAAVEQQARMRHHSIQQ